MKAMLFLLVILIIIAVVMTIVKMEDARRRKAAEKYEIRVLPAPSEGPDFNQVNLVRKGQAPISVGRPFRSYDESALDEYTLDAERLRKRIAGRN